MLPPMEVCSKYPLIVCDSKMRNPCQKHEYGNKVAHHYILQGKSKHLNFSGTVVKMLIFIW